MLLAPGEKLGAYEIVSPLGAGGMGEVYRARDAAVGRDVALKVLPAASADDPDRVDRLSREARALAALNHPNIAQLYGFEAGTPSFLVMELVPGSTLEAAIRERFERRSPTSDVLDWALPIARQIALALEAAHEAGIVHRDLKPANIKVRDDGTVKVLDFGLAKAVAPEAASGAMNASPDESPTMTAPPPTDTGMVLGTAAYMAPEQARGQRVDKRADIWAFGVVLFEMLTGERLFRRDTSLDTLTAVLTADVRWERLPADLPPSVRRLLARCLERDPKRRLRDVGDARLDLEDPVARDPVSGRQPVPGAAQSRSPERLLWVAALAAAAGLGWWLNSAAATAEPPWSRARPITETPEREREPHISPDGNSVAFVCSVTGSADICWRRVDGGSAIPIRDDPDVNEGGPAFSPGDGRRLAYHTFDAGNAGTGIYVSGEMGDNPLKVTDTGFNPSWSPDGQWIVYATERAIQPNVRGTGSELWIVAPDDANSEPRRLTNMDAMQPAWSPNGQRVAYWSAGTRSGSAAGIRDVYTIGVDGSDPVPVTSDLAVDWSPTWSPDGRHLYFGSDRGGTMGLWRVRIDETSGQILGEPEAVSLGLLGAVGFPSLSGDGRRLIFEVLSHSVNPAVLEFDPDTEALGEPRLLFEQNGLRSPQAISPDGQWLVYVNAGEPNEDLFVGRADGTDELRRITSGAYFERRPRWSPDGERLVFYSNRSGSSDIWTIRRDGSELRQVSDDRDIFYTFPLWPVPGDEILAITFNLDPPVTHVFDAVAAEPSGPVQTIAPPEGGFHMMAISPDGRRLAGNLISPARGLVYYDLAEGTWHAVLDQSAQPEWLPDSRRMLYVSAPDRLAIVDIETRAQRELEPLSVTVSPGLVVAPDGRSVYVGVTSSTSDLWLFERGR